jgi:hypothetical protein
MTIIARDFGWNGDLPTIFHFAPRGVCGRNNPA